MTVSLVIPAFDAAATLGETLDSVAAQDRVPDEVIVVDDGSVDGTADLARAHSVVSRLIGQPNGGAARAINTGIAAARGAWIAILDADDLLPSGSIRARLDAAGAETDAVIGMLESFLCPSLPAASASRLRWKDGRQRGFVGGAMLLRASLLDRVGPFDDSLRTGFFIEWFGRAQASGMRIAETDAVVLRRRIRKGTLGARTGAGDGLSRDMLEIARRRIAERRRHG
ncbi:MAG: glycosyltransferase family 2 protein [Rubricella sp.]